MRNLHSFLLTCLLFLGISAARADIVKMKNGTNYEGKITLQTPDLIKIEVPITDKIKETKTLAMKDVSEVIKTAADDAMFSKIQKMVPTDSLLSAEKYRSMLTTGPEAFLSQFAGSKHKEEVEKIKKTLEEELDKVERGNIKLEGEWYTPQDRNDFPKLIESKIVLYRMKNNAAGGRYLNYISAMRDFETLETKYFGTPAFAEAVGAAQKILPVLGQQLKGLRRDVDVKNAQWEASKNALNEVDRQRVEAARNREEAQFAAAVAADKKAKIRWTRVNPRSPSALDAYLQFAASEYKRINDLNSTLISERAEALVEVDQMIQKGELDRAKIKLAAAAELPISDKGNAKKSSSKGSTSYAGALREKLNEKESEKKAIAKAQSDAKKSEALAANLKETQDENRPSDLLSSAADATAGKGRDAEDGKGAVDDFDMLATNVPKKEEPAKAAPEKPVKKKTEKKERAPLPPAKKPFPFHLIGIALAVLAGGAVVAMKVLGIGGKGDDGGGEDDE